VARIAFARGTSCMMRHGFAQAESRCRSSQPEPWDCALEIGAAAAVQR
jgi:hypothetical protein